KLCPRAVDAVLAAVGAPRPARALPAGLTPRECEVLVELARGRTSKEIARALGIAVRTANHHVENIYAKIDVTTRAAAALFAGPHSRGLGSEGTYPLRHGQQLGGGIFTNHPAPVATVIGSEVSRGLGDFFVMTDGTLDVEYSNVGIDVEAESSHCNVHIDHAA